MKLNDRSIKALDGVHPDLVRVVYRAAELCDDLGFIVTEGVRTKERQAQLLRKGATKTLNSRHIPDCNTVAMGCAVDIAVTVDGEVRWDWPLYEKMALVFKEAAKIEDVKITWGGDWKLRDGPHYELSRNVYP